MEIHFYQEFRYQCFDDWQTVKNNYGVVTFDNCRI